MTFRSIYIVIHSFNLRFRSINHLETIPIDPSWLDMTKKDYLDWLDYEVHVVIRSTYIVIHSTWHDLLHLYCDSLH